MYAQACRTCFKTRSDTGDWNYRTKEQTRLINMEARKLYFKENNKGRAYNVLQEAGQHYGNVNHCDSYLLTVLLAATK